MTAEFTVPPTLTDLIGLADNNDERAHIADEAAAIEAAARLVDKARDAARTAIGLSTAEAHQRLTVTIDDGIARIYYASPDGMDGSLNLRYVPERHLGGGYGYELDGVIALHYCGECNGLVARQDKVEPVRDPLALGYALRGPARPVKWDPGHAAYCSLAYNEDADIDGSTAPSAQPVIPAADESLHRIACALEELVGRWPA